VAYGSASGQYLVVWQDKDPPKADYDVTARRVGDDGSLVGDEIPISTWEHDQVKPRLAFNSQANEFLVVWEDHHWAWGDARDIHGQRVRANGTLAGANFGISWDGANARLSPDVAYHADAGEYLVAWEYESTPDDHHVYSRRVGRDGALLEDEAVVSNGPFPRPLPLPVPRTRQRPRQHVRLPGQSPVRAHRHPRLLCSLTVRTRWSTAVLRAVSWHPGRAVAL